MKNQDISIINQLNHVYFNFENWHKHRETLAGITNYHNEQIEKGNLRVYTENNELLGYYELWLIEQHQLERILNEERFIAPFEDTTHGDIAYLANLWVKNDDRKYRTMRELRKLFFEQTKHCIGWIGHETKRKNRLRIFVNKEKKSNGSR
jgi:hemolysin-activating ACP:hemolysin acyltransferase